MNKNLPFLSLLTSVMILVLASCWPGPIYDPYVIPESRQKENLYYVPTAPNTHLLTEKNDADFNLIRSGGTKFSGVDVQASYLPGRHMGVVGRSPGRRLQKISLPLNKSQEHTSEFQSPFGLRFRY